MPGNITFFITGFPIRVRAFVLGLILFGLGWHPAQAGIYIMPSVGMGLSDASYRTAGGSAASTYSVLAWNFSFETGYSFEKLRLSTGLRYFRTGYSRSLTLIDSVNGNRDFEMNRYFDHVGIPLKVAYALRAGKRLALVPFAGIMISGNLFAATKENFSSTDVNTRVSSTDFNNNYHALGLWTTVGFNAECRMFPQLTAALGGGFDYMLTNISKGQAAAPGYPSAQHNYTFLLNAGVKWNFSEKKRLHREPRRAALQED